MTSTHHGGGTDPLFVYGTLLFPRVLRRLVGRLPRTEAAVAPGWRVAALDGRPYPGLVPGDGRARGKLLLDLDGNERAIIHAYEDDAYDLRPVLLEDGRRALAYVWGDHSAVLPHDWDPARHG